MNSSNVETMPPLGVQALGSDQLAPRGSANVILNLEASLLALPLLLSQCDRGPISEPLWATVPNTFKTGKLDQMTFMILSRPKDL